MPRRWLLMNELVFEIYRDRQCRTGMKVTVKNAGRGDEDFFDAVARLIQIWASTKEVPR